MARIKGETELFTAAKRIQGHLCAIQIKSDLSGMNFRRKLHPAVTTDIQNRVPLACEILKTFRDHTWARPGITAAVRPQRRTSQAAENSDTQLLRRAGGGAYLLKRALADASRV